MKGREEDIIIKDMEKYVEDKARLLICDLLDIQPGRLQMEDNEWVKKAVGSITQIINDVQGKNVE